MKTLFLKAEKLIAKAKNVLIVSHRKPDADTLGGAISLKILLEKLEKQTTLACIDKPSKSFGFLPHVEDFVQDFDLSLYDLMIVVDAGASYMTNFHLKYEDFFKSEIPILNIDHHSSNDNFGTLNLVDPGAASVTVIIYRFLNFMNYEIDEKIATSLLAGIYGDTGSFMHSNTSQEVLMIAADLMNKGAAVADISKSLFGVNSVATLRLWGKVLEKTQMTDDDVVISVLNEDDYNDIGAGPENLSGVVDYLNMIPGSKFAVLINEDRNGNVKGSFRTRNEEIDLSKIAAVFGGGGHPKASGFTLPGKIKEELRYTIVSQDMSKKSLDF